MGTGDRMLEIGQGIFALQHYRRPSDQGLRSVTMQANHSWRTASPIGEGRSPIGTTTQTAKKDTAGSVRLKADRRL
ncbi:hypothetical protein N7510_011022 [Penicillium lagena]|uniref:uncharacterized protein n=1 Tax=Penicillium lagena TaxID=94218 RepID=UPI0025405B16|nr:uncharacterized protein N7510_011022 [Penicillium lagena]KAJ5601488.1 hypothetical protein N7510_011022 [Penicillium lagena]